MYTEIKADIWNFTYDSKVIPTNCRVKQNGRAVMGKGLALQASRNYSTLALRYGTHLKNSTDIKCIYYPDINLIMFPTKYNYDDKADYGRIEKSMKELYDICIENNIKRIIMPKVGCGEGKLLWDTVKARILNILNCEDIEFIIVSNRE